jgi:glycosyltransferase involved in cell wall biosynthesis
LPRISVIIPAYNVENFLPRALDSILDQRLSDIEVLVVDDGSADGTGRVCDEYAAKDERVRTLHQKNGGAPAARNAAIALARGEYIYFMDADDWAEKDMLSDMYALARDTGAEMVVAGFYIDTYTSETDFWQEKKALPDALYTDAASFRKAATGLFDNNLLYTPWNKLFLAERIMRENIRFRNTKMDDFPFNIDYIRDVSTVAVTEKAYYHFTRARSESETAGYYPQMFQKRQEEHGWMVELYEHWGLADDPAAREFLARRYVERIIGCIQNSTCAACRRTAREKRGEIALMINCDNTRWSLKYARPRSFMMKVMLVPVRLRSAYLCWLLGETMSFVRAHFVGVFARLKAFR